MKRVKVVLISMLALVCFAEPLWAEGAKEEKGSSISYLSDGISLYPLIKGVVKGGDSLKQERVKMYSPKIISLLETRYDYDESGEESNNTFSIGRARLGIMGNIHKDISYVLYGDFAGTPKLLYAYLTYSPIREVGFTFGQFKLPTSFENLASTLRFETIDASRSVGKLMGPTTSLGSSISDRDAGAYIGGGFFHREDRSILNYTFGVVNGTGQNVKDDNNDKDIFAVLLIKATSDLSFISSFTRGVTGPVGEDQHLYTRFLAGVQYHSSRLMLRSEYMRGKTVDILSDGFYATLQVPFVDHFAAVAKYDLFRYDVTDSSMNQNYYTAGITYILNDFMRAQANYTYVHDCTIGNYSLAGLHVKIGF